MSLFPRKNSLSKREKKKRNLLLSGVVHTGIKVHRMDLETSRLVE